MNKITDGIKDVLSVFRRTGQTAACIGTLYQNHNAIMVVGNHQIKQTYTSVHPILKNRIFTLAEVAGFCGVNQSIIVWDNTAIMELITKVRSEIEFTASELSMNQARENGFKKGMEQGRREGYEDGFKEGKAFKDDQKQYPPTSNETLRQLSDVMGKIGDMYNVNIFIVPKR